MRRAVAALLLFSSAASAQHEHHQPAPDQGWAWSIDSSAFLTGNLQDRKLRDFHQVESQNWLMGTAASKVGIGSLTLHGMLSFEPFTLRELGSSQVLQTAVSGQRPVISGQ